MHGPRGSQPSKQLSRRNLADDQRPAPCPRPSNAPRKGLEYAAVIHAVKTLGLIITDLTKVETSQGLQRALGHNFQRLLEDARRQWERRCADRDPSDACVSVRIVAADTPAVARKATRGSGPVKSSRQLEQRSNLSLPRYAH